MGPAPPGSPAPDAAAPPARVPADLPDGAALSRRLGRPDPGSGQHWEPGHAPLGTPLTTPSPPRRGPRGPPRSGRSARRAASRWSGAGPVSAPPAPPCSCGPARLTSAGPAPPDSLVPRAPSRSRLCLHRAVLDRSPAPVIRPGGRAARPRCSFHVKPGQRRDRPSTNPVRCRPPAAGPGGHLRRADRVARSLAARHRKEVHVGRTPQRHRPRCRTGAGDAPAPAPPLRGGQPEGRRRARPRRPSTSVPAWPSSATGR